MAELDGAPAEDSPYTITADEQSEELTPAGNFRDVHRISFETPSGNHGYIRIPDASYSAANVHALVQERVNEMERVAQLGQGPPPE